jgi:RNA polymerase sigma-70 factor (ECF subfamily)
MSGIECLLRFIDMPLSEQEILRILMNSRDRISAAVWMIVRDAHMAEDIFQNVSVKAMTRDVVFEHEGAVLSWAFITARHEGVDWLRKTKREMPGVDAGLIELMEQEWLNERSTRGNARTDALRDCIERLPQKSRRLMKLRYYDGLNCRDVAIQMEAKLDAVYKRISRVHQGLRSCIETRMAGVTRDV